MIIREQAAYIFYGALRLGLGAFFLVVGCMKLFQVDQLAADIERFGIVSAGYEWYLACLGVAMEIMIGFFLLIRRLYVAAALAGSVLTICFVAIFIQAWFRGLNLSCNCLGVEREVANYPFEIGWRMLLCIGMLFLLREALRKSPYRFSREWLDTSELL